MSAAELDYIVITSQAEDGGSTGFSIIHYWDARTFTHKSDAVSHGFRSRGSDDFNIGVVRNGRLLSVWWMDHQVSEPQDALTAIGQEIGLEASR